MAAGTTHHAQMTTGLCMGLSSIGCRTTAMAHCGIHARWVVTEVVRQGRGVAPLASVGDAFETEESGTTAQARKNW